MYSLYNATRVVIGWMWFHSVSQYCRRKWHIDINLAPTACCALSWVIVLFRYIMDIGPLNYPSIPAFGLQRTVIPDNADVTQYSSHGLIYAYSPIHLPGLSSSAHKFTHSLSGGNAHGAFNMQVNYPFQAAYSSLPARGKETFLPSCEHTVANSVALLPATHTIPVDVAAYTRNLVRPLPIWPSEFPQTIFTTRDVALHPSTRLWPCLW